MIIDPDTKHPPPPTHSSSSLLIDVTDPSESFATGPSSSSSFHPNSSAPPPPFVESAADKALNAELAREDVFVPLGGEEPPPEFTPYEAEFFLSGAAKDVVSHDPHLNEDGEALYRFLLSRARDPPKLTVSLDGTHSERRYRTVTSRDAQGRTHRREESYEETVTDFAFAIDLTQHVVPDSVVHWSVPDEEPAYRGRMYEEVDGVFAVASTGAPIRLEVDAEEGRQAKGARRQAVRQEVKSAKAWRASRWQRGLPPWVGPGSVERVAGHASTAEANVMKSSRTLREWADEYCASDKWLKEFTYEKVVYGWNLGALEAAITAAVKSTYYDGDFTVKFNLTQSKIHVRPNSQFARLLSQTWFKVILWCLLIYPFIWLYKRFSTHGGGRWEVCGGAYALKRWQPLEEDPSAPPPPFSEANGVVSHGAVSGHARLQGMKEGEWFQMWEGTIKRGVTGRLKARSVLMNPEGPTPEASMLDGYRA
ncbi:hypothetical protein EIP91_005759 [Steccherinum ochraceum]|uniref:Uncharacterized protein n=1 Tax=Steccherinum ochraceum TaxID=92696 RepID=A0A4R0RTW8_9APHY|nr:hypothetical protein EIP91_005759 [Steccherinum ochraceum]